MLDEGLEPLLGVRRLRDCLPRALEHVRKAALLNEREQVFLAADVVVHPGQRHPAGGGQITHGRGVVALVRKDPGRAGKEVVETLVVRWSHEIRTFVRTRSYRGGRRWARASAFVRLN